MVVRGRLRLYSASGFFLLLGLIILAFGIGMATLGYWPHGETKIPGKFETSVESQTVADREAKWSNEARIVTDGDEELSSRSHHVQGIKAAAQSQSNLSSIY